MKFLILVVFATLGVASADLNLWDWNPVPVNDSIVQQALDAKKSQIILDVIQKHPNITHNPIFDLNSADKMYSMEKILPPFVYYRINLTLAIRKTDPFNSKFIGIYTPIVTFNVTLKTQTFDSHVDVIGNPQYDGIELTEKVPLPELVKVPFKNDLDVYQWNPVPVDDASVKQTLDSKKSQIILDVIQVYPNITHNPIFHLNSADKRKSGQRITPPFFYYRLNLTLAIFKADPLNSKLIGIYTPIVTFNVTFKTQTYKSHLEVIGNPKYSGIVLPHLAETIPLPELVKTPFHESDFKADYQGTIRNVNLPSNDTGLTIAIAALQDKIWQKLEENNIHRPNATSAPKDDFVPSINYTLYKYSRNKTTGNLQSQYSVSLNVLSTAKDSPPFSFLLIKPKKPVKIWVTLQVQHSSGAETFELTYFNFVADSSEKDSSSLLKLDLVSAGPSKADDHDCNHYLGNPQPLDPKSKHLWTVFNALKKDILKWLRFVKFYVTIPDDSFFIFNNGQVQYKDNHGDLDKPIVREITVNFTIKENPGSGDNLYVPLKTILNTKVILQESISPLNATSSYKLLQVDNCKIGGVCPY